MTADPDRSPIVADLPSIESPAAEPADAETPLADATNAPDAELRARLMAQFERWLDGMLAEEPAPRGLPAELLEAVADLPGGAPAAGEPDLFSLFSALTALTGEIRLQGRAFKQLADAVAPVAEAAPALRELPDAQRQSTEKLAEALDRLAEDEDELAIGGDEVCQTLLDLYDRLERGLRTCRQGMQSIRSAQPTGLLWRMSGGPAYAQVAESSALALADAGALTLARLQSVLQQWGIERIGNVGEPFDPRRMSAVDVRAGDGEPGTVVEVLRSGWATGGTVRSPARVAVAGNK